MFSIKPIPILEDNYSWLLQHAAGNQVYIIDPGEAEPINRYLTRHSLLVKAIIITHSHPDHIMGINALQGASQVPIFGPKSSRIPQVTHLLNSGDCFKLWDQFPVIARSTPGHLPEHLSYIVSSDDINALFCGDILFSGGCGRIFDGTARELKSSLDGFKDLPSDTQVFCGHEYTIANLRFAASVEPNNPEIARYQDHVANLRAQNIPSIPTTLGQEKAINPFLRCDQESIQQAVSEHVGTALASELEVFTELRRWKNVFKG